MLAASAAFRVAPNPTVAADVVGALLARWHYIALAAPLLLFAIELRKVRRFVLVALFVALILATLQSLVDLRIRMIRATSPVAVSSLERDHPVRRQFGALHGASMLLLLLQAIAAAGVVAAKEKREEETMPADERDDLTIYKVVVNAEKQYSIWPANRELPLGWTEAGFEGLKHDCLEYVKKVWEDMRPPLRNTEDADTTGGGP